MLDGGGGSPCVSVCMEKVAGNEYDTLGACIRIMCKSPDAAEAGCDAYKGGPGFGLCNAFCKAKNCASQAILSKSCEKLRSNFFKKTGNELPCLTPPQEPTCSGFCGEAGEDGSCFCDTECVEFGDCCPDYEEFCPVPSPAPSPSPTLSPTLISTLPPSNGPGTCEGFCGGPGSDGESCFCDNDCVGLGDCCPDYENFCLVPTLSPTPSPSPTPTSPPFIGTGTCDGFCGGIGSDESCFCDNACVEIGDCCPDYEEFCLVPTLSPAPSPSPIPSSTFPPFNATGTCNGFCGGAGSDDSCFCDNDCVEIGDCCPDYEEFCLVPTLSPAPSPTLTQFPTLFLPPFNGTGTCDGFCGGIGSDGFCYCDSDCVGAGDCCPDYEEFCVP